MRFIFCFTLTLVISVVSNTLVAGELTLKDMFANGGHVFTSVDRDRACRLSRNYWYNKNDTLISPVASDPICSCRTVQALDISRCANNNECLISNTAGWACNFLGPVNTAALNSSP